MIMRQFSHLLQALPIFTIHIKRIITYKSTRFFAKYKGNYPHTSTHVKNGKVKVTLTYFNRGSKIMSHFPILVFHFPERVFQCEVQCTFKSDQINGQITTDNIIVRGETTGDFDIRTELRQGDTLLQLLFNLTLRKIIRHSQLK